MLVTGSGYDCCYIWRPSSCGGLILESSHSESDYNCDSGECT